MFKLKYNYSNINKFWKDEGIKWNASDYEGITTLKMDARDIWTPGLKHKITQIYLKTFRYI